MAKFDLWFDGLNIVAEKVKRPHDSNISGATYLKTITTTSKTTAVRIANKQIEIGLIKLPEATKEQPMGEMPKFDEVNKAIFCDFNGVLDDQKRTSNSSSLAFRLPEIACPDKVYRLAKLAVKHNAKLVLTSLHRLHGGSLDCIIYRSLENSNNPEHKAFIKENDDLLGDLTMVCPTPDFGDRSLEVLQSIRDEEFTHYVVFEDEHFIDPKLNPIMTEWSVGLQDEHIEKADAILSA